MRNLRLRVECIGLVLFSGVALAQNQPSTRAYALRGCWKLEAGTFKLVDSIHVGPGETTSLPRFIEFDTLTGRGLFDRPMGHVVRGLDKLPHYQEGYFRFPHPDTVEVNWTSGFTGMTLTFPFATGVMRGRADAWTDYGGAEWAPVTIRRVACPT